MKPLLAAFAAIALAQTPKPALTVDWIMRGPGLYGYEPQRVRWSRDSARVYFEWKRHDAPVLADADTYVANRDGSALRKLTDEEKRNAPPAAGELSPDKSATIFTEDGDVFVYDHAAALRKRLTRTGDIESGARFWRDARHVTYARGGNLFLLDLDEDTVEQLTEIRAAGSPPLPSTVKGTESQEFLKQEERSLLSVVEERAKLREEREGKRKKENPREPWTLPARHTVQQMALSPDGATVFATIVEGGEKNKRTIVPNYVTEAAYTEDIPARDKVGDSAGASKLALFERVSGKQKWVDFKANLTLPSCSDDEKHCVVRARAADNKDVWLLALDGVEGKVRELVKIHDDAWVRVPGFGLTSGWLADGKYFYLSEQSGYAHVYAVSPSGGEPKQLTSGAWEVRTVELSDDKRVLYLSTAEAGAAETHLYATSIDGGARRRLTTQPGEHLTTVAPDGTIADVSSYSNKPPELFVGGKQVTQSPSPDFASYPWIDPPIVEIPARDGAKVPARMYKPANFRKGGPLVVFVHGAGYLQNAHKYWSSYSREYMFHHLLMDRGYMVLDVDYRGSAGYGRDWRTAIYRHMGGKDLDDQVDAVKWAVANHGVDPKRVGLYGGSYGGFIALMALFTQPDVFAAGAALRPVTDWAHYNQGYTSNILNLPQKDTEAYRKSSPIYHAAGLKGALLICHGMVDVNVHYQDSVRLVQKLIELRKENWEFASYPVEDHGFVQPTSWADEYKRILKLFETNLAAKTVESKAPSSTSRR